MIWADDEVQTSGKCIPAMLKPVPTGWSINKRPYFLFHVPAAFLYDYISNGDSIGYCPTGAL